MLYICFHFLKNVPSCTPTENLRSGNQSWKASKGSCVKWIPLGEPESRVLMAGSSPTSRDFSNELPISRSSPRVLRLEAAAPHYHNNQLQVKVFWKSRLPGKWSQNQSSRLTFAVCVAVWTESMYVVCCTVVLEGCYSIPLYIRSIKFRLLRDTVVQNA